MELSALLQQHREAVLEKWFKAIAETYPRQTSPFLTRQKDRFRNPIGYAIERSIGPVYDQLSTDMNEDALRDDLDSIVRIRSVQEFTPARAVAFVFDLKTIIRNVLGDSGPATALEAIDERIDRIALIAFDKYAECRQRMFEIRTEEIRRQSVKIMERYTAKPRASHTKGEPVDDVT
jgi:hypothetical protein